MMTTMTAEETLASEAPGDARVGQSRRSPSRSRRRHVATTVGRRLVHISLVLLIVVFGTMALLQLTPGGPALAILGDQGTPEQLAALDKQLGFDRPLPERFVRWLGDAVTGDLGDSLVSRRPVTDIIRERLPVTIELALLSLTVALTVSIGLALLAAYHAGSRLDRGLRAATSVLNSSPGFLTALALVYLLAVRNHVFPVTGWTYLRDSVGGNLRHAALPAATLALAEIPYFFRVLRADLVSALQQDFILAARAKGLGPLRILFGHALRPSSFSMVTLAGLSLGGLLGGAVIAETIFAVPGIGQTLAQSIFNKDLPVVQGIVVVIAAMYVAINALVDVGYSYLDPRVRGRRA